MTTPPINSPNFGFLARHNPLLVRLAGMAERYVFEDPNSTLIKLRQFAELLAEHCAAHAGIVVEEQESFLSVLDKLWSAHVTEPQTAQLFHGLRKAGNRAAHEHEGDQSEALHQLQMARKLAVWFHKSFGNDPNFHAGAFVPPPNPVHVANELQAELERLRNELATVTTQTDGIQATVDEHARVREEAEAAAQSAYTELNAALELAEETEQQLAQEREQFQQQLAELQGQVAAAPIAERRAKIQAAQEQAAEIDLDEVATRHIIDAQLREAGWEADTETLRYSKGTRPTKGRNLAIAEWPTANGPADYGLFVGLTPVAVVEAKRKRKDVSAAIEQSKRYSRGFAIASDQDAPGGPWDDFHVPFLFATNGRPFLRQVAEKSGIWFLDVRRPVNHPRPLEDWYTPEGLTQLLNQSEANLDQLDQSILAKAFRGELVPQDPKDEPAAVLLERIRQQREAAAQNGQPKRKTKRTSRKKKA